MLRAYAFMRERPLMFMGAIVGIALFVLIFFGGRTIIRENDKLRERVRVIERDSPCTDLTSAECAIKLFRALPEEQRERLRISEQTLRALERRAERERNALRPDQDGSPGRPPGAGGDSPGGDDPGVPRPPGQPPGSSPQEPPTSEPDPEPEPEPLAKTPTIKTPMVGPIQPIEIPSVEVPCIEVQDIINC